MSADFPATYPGGCYDCGGHIKVGERIVRVGGLGPRRYAHVTCPDAPPSRLDLRPTDVVCSSCFMVKPCPCDDGQAPA